MNVTATGALQSRPYLVWQKQDSTRLGFFYHVSKVRELWADMVGVPVTRIQHMSGPTVLDRAMIYSQWKIGSEYFIESLPYAIGLSADRVPRSTFDILHISMEAHTA